MPTTNSQTNKQTKENHTKVYMAVSLMCGSGEKKNTLQKAVYGLYFGLKHAC